MDKIIEFNINTNVEDNDRLLEIEELCKSGMTLNSQDVLLLLSKLSYVVRKKIAEYEDTDMTEYSYSYKCDLAQSMICYYLRSLGIRVNPVNTNEVINGVTGHSLVVADFDTELGPKTYLVDPTYIQFFSKENCSSSKYIILQDRVCISPDPGYFIVKNNNEDLVMPLLENGYIELTAEVATAYGDSFFQTKQGTTVDQVSNNVASGLDYIRWFKSHTSKLSKTEDELSECGLLIESLNNKQTVRK